MDLTELLAFVVKNKASDLHLSSGLPPMIRVHGDIRRINVPALEHKDVHGMIYDIMNDGQRKFYEENLECDFSFAVPNLARFRVNAFVQQRGAAAVMRTIPSKILSLADLKCPKIFEEIADQPRGIVLVTGPTGSGKSTTLAGMVDAINRREQGHIITLEDPIEYAFASNKCAIEQREVGADVTTFASGLRHSLRQDPDVILVGEMRDLETTSSAITAAETGHLVFSTLHTVNAPQTIERIIDIYPSDEQNQIRSMLANTLQAVISQTLFKRIDQPGMIPGVEIMLCTPAVRNCVRENRIFEIPNIIATSRALGMQSLDDSIRQLFVNGYVSREDAIAQAAHPEKLERSLAA
jgi:twitching motility protein PilT